jgi:YegS/Rv2252/BmrU family lipid kinase
MMSPRIQVVVNPAAGQPQPVLWTLNRVFRETDARWDVGITHEPGDGVRIAREAAEAGADVVAAYGGDGTVMEVANGLMETDVPLAILPGGTGNILSVELGIPQALEDAARLACSDERVIRQVDVAQAGNRYFLLRLWTGYTAKQLQNLSRESRDQYGRLAYAISAFQALSEREWIRLSFELDGEQVDFEGVACMVANAASLGIPGLSLSPEVDIGDGLIDVLSIRDIDLNALSALAASIASIASKPESMRHWQVREVTITTDPVQPVVADGEDWGETPVTVKVLPQALRVIVPQAPAAG